MMKLTNKMRIIVGFIILFALLSISYLFTLSKKEVSGSRLRDAEQTKEFKEYLTLIQKEVKQRDVSIIFYGKVVDQYAQPISGAEVDIHIRHYDPHPPRLDDFFSVIDSHLVKTDQNGLFKITREKGDHVFINDIKMTAYDKFSYKDNATSFEYKKEGGFIPDKTNPVIFHLRKKQETIYLIHWQDFRSRIFYGNETEEAWHLDLVWPDFRPVHLTNLNVNYGSKPMYTDVIVQVRSNQTQHGYNVFFAVPDRSGGILETNVLMYTAPGSGYQTNLVYYIPVINKEMFETNAFFYIKSRGGKVYARMNASFISYGYDKDRVVIDVQFWANPYGDRNLEEEPRLKYETTERLHDEAEATLLQGKLPPKPNIQQLLKTEGEYKE